MSQYDQIDIAKITNPRIAFICARLNLRFGKRRLQKGLTAAGMIALYDSILFGMRYYITQHEGCEFLVQNIDVWDAANLFQALVQADVFDDPLTLNRFNLLVERALWQPSISFDTGSVLAEVETILSSLGVMSGGPRPAH